MTSPVVEDDMWIRPATEVEYVHDVAQRHGCVIAGYLLVLNSSVPIKEEHLRKALSYLYRKVPILRLCMRDRNGQLWLRNMDNEKVDLQILPGGNAERELEKIIHEPFNSTEGPMWRVKMLPANSSASSTLPEINEGFPYKFNLLYSIHHSLSDGYSNYNACSLLLSLLNDVIAGQAVSTEQLGEFLDYEDVISCLGIAHDAEAAGIHLKNKGTDEGASDIDLLWRKAFPVTEKAVNQTLCTVRDLSFDTTQKLKAKFKAKGVTFHSGFCTATDTALVEMFQESGVDMDSYCMHNTHNLDLRRYMNIEKGCPLGCLVGILKFASHAPRDIKDRFWDYASTFHKTLHMHIENQVIGDDEFYDTEGFSADPTFLKDFFGRPPEKVVYYYSANNMKNLSSVFPDEGDIVQLSSVRESTSIHCYPYAACIWLLTFRGRLTFGFDYTPAIISPEDADEWADKIASLLEDIASE